MLEEMIKIVCAKRGWKYNNFTAYLVESKIPYGRIADTMGVNRGTAHSWLHKENLSGAVNFLFLAMRKMRLQNVDLLDYF